MIRKLSIIICLIAGGLILLGGCQHSPEGQAEALPYRQGNGWGLIRANGETVVPSGTFPTPPSAVISRRFYAADSSGRYQLYDADSPLQPVSSRHFLRIGYFREETAPAQEEAHTPILLIDRNGNTRATLEAEGEDGIVLAHNFREGRALVGTRSGKFGYVNCEGKLCIPAVYDYAGDFYEGKALVAQANGEGKLGFQVIDTRGRQLFALQQSQSSFDTRYSDGLLKCRSLQNGRITYLNEQGEEVFQLPESITDAFRFSYGAAVCRTQEGYGAIDKSGRFIIPPQYDGAEIIGDNRIALCQKGEWSICDFSNRLVSENSYRNKPLFYQWETALQATDSLIQDPYARGEEVEVFIRCAENGGSEELAVATEAAEGEKQPTTAGRPTDAPEKEGAPHKEVHETDWRKAAKSSPFYPEIQKILSGRLEERDATRREVILDYVERLRMAYNTKDMEFISQVFSDKALIIVGKVIHTLPSEEARYLSNAQVVYSVKSKKDYLERLGAVFRSNRHIELKFSDFRIARHPSVEGIYGVSLRQAYRSSLYSDDGYLFLLWDFRDAETPKIHVRTWQPSMLDNQTPLPEKDIIDISIFNF